MVARRRTISEVLDAPAHRLHTATSIHDERCHLSIYEDFGSVALAECERGAGAPERLPTSGSWLKVVEFRPGNLASHAHACATIHGYADGWADAKHGPAQKEPTQ